jgi:hypothetical protein
MTSVTLTSGGRTVALALLLASPGPHVQAGERASIHLRTSEAFAPCLAPALQAFARESGLSVVVDVGDLDPPRGADVVVGDDSEMTRLLEGGIADLETSFDLGSLPWVMVVPVGSPAGALSSLAPERVAVLGGRASGAAREALQGMPTERVRISRNPDELRQARYALVPRSLAGPGEQRPSGVHPLMAVTAVVSDAPHPSGAQALLAFLGSERARRLLTPCLDPPAPESNVRASAAASVAKGSYAKAVVDWWLPECTLMHNAYNDPIQVLGPPDTVKLGKDDYRGMMSLGQGGYVTVDMVDSAIDGPGPDIRVYQITGDEPVTLYAATSPQGPYTLVALRVPCGERTAGFPNFERHCDFDLRDAGMAEARYFKIEDGEIYPCLSGGTVTEGADIDAIEILNKKP